MARGGLRWQRLAGLLVGLAAGAICLVLWSSSSPAAALDVHDPFGAASTEQPPPGPIGSAIEQVADPVTELPPLPTVVDRAATAIVAPVAPLPPAVVEAVTTTVSETEAAAIELTEPIVGPILPALPSPDLPALPELPILPDLGDGIDVGSVTIPAPAAPPGRSGTVGGPAAPAAAAGDTGLSTAPSSAPDVERSSAGSVVTEQPPATPGRPVATIAASAPGGQDAPAAPAPWPQPLEAALSLAGTATGSTSVTALVAVLSGLTLLAMGPRWARLSLRGPQTPGAVVHAIVSPPD